MNQAHRLRDGCQMCGGRVIEDHDDGTWTSDVHYVPLDNFAGPGGRVQTIRVPVCGTCYPTLATMAGINKLTQMVNGTDL